MDLLNKKRSVRLNEYKKEFQSVPFDLLYRPIYNASSIATYVFPLFSFSLAAYYLTTRMPFESPIFAAVLSILFAVFIEFLKGKSITYFFKSFYRKTDTTAIGVLASTLLCMSIAASFFGAIDLKKDTDVKHKEFVENLNTKRLALAEKQMHERRRLQTEYEKFVEANTVYFGKDDNGKKKFGLNSRSIKTSNAFQKRISDLQQKHEKSLQELTETNKVLISDSKNDLTESIIMFAIIALLIDLFIATSNWFRVYYKYKSAEELIFEEKFGKELDEEPLEPDPERMPTVGEVSLQNESAKVISIVNDLRKGITHNKTLMEKHKTNPRTIARAKKFVAS
ncbi:hypothetical protein [Flammeovirga agarivorans]|uniref:DUF4407 domain-containing protein n=1 Tax=Flammeovirga agarivorans TaxID=2726742 RepID=A0A7X8SRK2_9BACT|nr:hypothetical protein [Flammeovirga agarivorans]NLR94942.1 hypothetical protein [Flammeovirga agarivorans]